MALAATAPRWDDEIVPALRKRLESESQYLSHRLSLSGGGSDYGHEDYDYYAASPSDSPSPDDGNGDTSYGSANGSRIPRPSLQGRRPEAARAAVTTTASGSQYKRARTQSTPYADPQSASRATSPTAPVPSRIPVPRGRSPSFSSRMLDASGTSPTDIRQNSIRSQSPVGVPPLVHQRSDLRLEVAPFGSSAPSSMSSARTPPHPNKHLPPANSFGQISPRDAPRMSMESDERPFEHWYRGDTARNGGVGELRVGRQQDMLDIASYGHRALEQARVRAHTPGTPDRRTSGRRRADSLGAGENLAQRGSFYMDPEEEQGNGTVLDERPPSDVDAGLSDAEYDPRGYYYDEGYDDGYEEDERAKTPVPLKSASQSQAKATTPTTPIGTPSKSSAKKPPASRSATTNGRLTTPTPSARKNGGPSPAASTSSLVKSAASPNSKTPARKGATTPTSTASPAAKGRGSGTPRGTPAKRGGAAGAGRGAKRPSPSSRSPSSAAANTSSYTYDSTADNDDSLADAIPTWTQPTANAAGNWDNVVLPTVARKHGLQQSLWTEADGSPKPVKTREEGMMEDGEYEPAPGTFGYDWARYKPPRADGEGGDGQFGEGMGMVEMQREKSGTATSQTTQTLVTPGTSTVGSGMLEGSESTQPLVERRRDSKPPPSKPQPAVVPMREDPRYPPMTQGRQDKRHSEGPFAAYGHNVQPTTMQVPMSVQPASRFEDEEKEKDAGGCCRCVVM